MGHSWREMDPAGAEKHDNEIRAQIRLRTKLGLVSLARFRVNELPMLMQLLECEASSEDMGVLRRKLRK